MRIKTTLVMLSLAICCFILGLGVSSRKLDCSKYEPDEKHPIACPRTYKPVCGTDGNTYANECELCAKILNGTDIDLAHRGKCVDCSMYPEPPKGMSTDCPKEYLPVCGTDGRTYAHKCILCATIRALKVQIGIRYKGECKKKG